MTLLASRPAAVDRRLRALPLAGLIGAGLTAVVVATWATLPEPPFGLPTAGPWVEFGLPVARLVLDVAALVTVGLSLLPKLLGFDHPEATEPAASRARRWAVYSAVVWAFAALVSTLLSAAEVMPDRFPDVPLFVDAIGSGQGLVVSAAAATLSAAIGMFAVRFGEKVPAELRVGAAVFGLLPLPVTGHATNWYWHDLSMVAMELHVIGAALWTGGLLAVALLLAADRELLGRTLPRFSRLATWALLVVAASGLFSGIVELLLSPAVPFPASLVTTDYGVLVLVKGLLAGVIALLGANIRFRLLPGVVARRPTAFAAWAAVELTVLGLAYGVAVVITRTGG
uniref:copper resistance D family protein n=1 Tax=Herbidospora sakaeratensis TaxID=564415 RepID=UPI000783D957|nr:CopD family protein [Herbidospora sakaeratensis]